MMAQTFPWICRHCTRSGLPTLQKINNTLTDFQETTSKKLNRLENTTLKNMQENNDTKFAKLDQKMTDLENAIDSKIEKKVEEQFEDKKEDLKKEVTKCVEENINKTMMETIEKTIDEKLKSFKHPDIKQFEENVIKMVNDKIKELAQTDEKAIEENLMKKVEERLKEITPDTKQIESNIMKKMEKKLNKPNTEEMRKIVKETVEEHSQSIETPTTSNPVNQVSPRTYMRTTVKNVACEIREKERRMKNIIIHGIQ